MAAPVAGYIQLPLDSGNLGKKVRSQTRIVGADTVHEHFFVPISARDRLGVYYVHSTLLTIPVSAHTPATTAYVWFVNPAGSAVKAALRRFRVSMQFLVTTAIDVSVPRQVIALFTETGAPSGASITPGKRDSTDATAVASVRTAVTGMTVTPGAIIRSELPPINSTASSATVQMNQPTTIGQPWDLAEEEMPVLRAGEGIVFYSADAGTTANRRMVADMIWEEYS